MDPQWLRVALYFVSQSYSSQEKRPGEQEIKDTHTRGDVKYFAVQSKPADPEESRAAPWGSARPIGAASERYPARGSRAYCTRGGDR